VVLAAGNTALRDAKVFLAANEKLQFARIEHVSLAAVLGFEDEFVDCMAFPKAGTESCELASGGRN